MMKLLVPLSTITLLDRAATCRSSIMSSVLEAFGLTSRAITLARGNQLGQKLQTLGHQLAAEIVMPVMLPSGRARLATRPSSTGMPANTIGIVVVASFAARAERAPPVVRDHVHLAATRSAANADSRS